MKKLIIFLIILYPLVCIGQEPIKELNSADIRSSLKLLGLEVFKYDFSPVKDDYGLTIYIDQYVNDSLVLSKPYAFGKWEADAEQKEFKLISHIESDTSDVYWLNLVHPNMELNSKVDIPVGYRNAHYWMELAPGDIEYETKVPLLFCGLSWEDEIQGMKIRRFCWGEDVQRDMQNETLDNIEHMILVSYELTK